MASRLVSFIELEELEDSSIDSIIVAASRQTTAFNTMKRTSTLLQSARTKVSPIGAQAKRAYSSEMANALVQVSQNLGMGSAAIGLGGAGIVSFINSPLTFFIKTDHASGYWSRFRRPSSVCCPQPIPPRPALLLRYFGLRLRRGYWCKYRLDHPELGLGKLIT